MSQCDAHGLSALSPLLTCSIYPPTPFKNTGGFKIIWKKDFSVSKSTSGSKQDIWLIVVFDVIGNLKNNLNVRLSGIFIKRKVKENNI